jgi:NAD(P)-dependent dehydrogenase (short-subunit alcohol dehydrogenase family)
LGKLDGKVAIVAGAATGIGRVTGAMLAAEGAHVAIADINADGAKNSTEEIRAAGGDAIDIVVDVSNESSVQDMVGQAVATWGRLDILHNNAAPLHLLARDTPIHLQDVDVWDQSFAVIARGTFLGCKYAIPHMIASGGGSIVNTSSGASLTGAWTNHAYGAAKGAVNTLTKCIATRYGKEGIRCNAVAPGYILNPEVERTMPTELQEKFSQGWLDQMLTRRVGKPEDIARTVLFLSTDDAEFITGQILPVDGGLLAWGPWSRFQTDAGYRIS